MNSISKLRVSRQSLVILTNMHMVQMDAPWPYSGRDDSENINSMSTANGMEVYIRPLVSLEVDLVLSLSEHGQACSSLENMD
jgi:hypothetical protein